jgi:hypothetical protein
VIEIAEDKMGSYMVRKKFHYCGLRMSWDSLKFLGKRSARISSPTTKISTMKPEKVPNPLLILASFIRFVD